MTSVPTKYSLLNERADDSLMAYVLRNKGKMKGGRRDQAFKEWTGVGFLVNAGPLTESMTA